jgi:hypothetical protein
VSPPGPDKPLAASVVGSGGARATSLIAALRMADALARREYAV